MSSEDRYNVTNMPATAKTKTQTNKPLIEKRRRERINHCLSQIKQIIFHETGNQVSTASKMEKADILDMAVKYLQENRSGQTSSLQGAADGIEEYYTGYVDCLKTTLNFINSQNVSNRTITHDLVDHLTINMKESIMSTQIRTSTPVSCFVDRVNLSTQFPGLPPVKDDISAFTSSACDLSHTNQNVHCNAFKVFRGQFHRGPLRSKRVLSFDEHHNGNESTYSDYLCNTPSSNESDTLQNISTNDDVIKDEIRYNLNENCIADPAVWRPW